MEYDKTNKGTLGKNTRKEKDTHPDYSGNINVEGTVFWLSGWIKTNATTGDKFFSLSVKRQEVKEGAPKVLRELKPTAQADDDSIPF
jgi:hypothetical protein